MILVSTEQALHRAPLTFQALRVTIEGEINFLDMALQGKEVMLGLAEGPGDRSTSIPSPYVTRETESLLFLL